MAEMPNIPNQAAAPPTPPPDSAVSPGEPFISKRELARRLNKSLRTIQYWQRRGIIPYIKCGRSALFNWTEIQAHLQSNFRVCRDPGPSRQEGSRE